MDGHIKFLLLIVIAIFTLMSLAMPAQFLTIANFESMAFQMSEIGILTVAMALAMLIGGIDLSVTATANISAIIAAFALVSMAAPDAPTPQVLGAVIGALMAAIAVGLACGLVNGFLIGFVGVSSVLATLGTLTLYTGLAFVITKGHAVHGVPSAFLFFGIGKALGIPMPLVILGAVFAVVSIILNRTAHGFKMYMLGSNPIAARFSGINNSAIILKTHATAGILSALAGLVILARTNSANADYGSPYVLMTILIAVLGGVSVSGGSGRIIGVILALAALQMLSTGLNMLLLRFSGSNFFRDFAWGLLLLFVVAFTEISSRRRRL